MRRVLIGVLPVSGLAFVLTPSPTDAAPPSTAQVGQAAPLPSGSSDVGPQSSSTSLKLDVALAPQDPAALSAFIEQLYDPSSSEYHHFLAAGQFGPLYGATQSSIQQVSSELSSLGLDPGPVSSDDLIIPVSTTVSAAESAFGVHIDQYNLPSGAAAYANTTAPQVPSSLAGDITTITGLSNAPQEVPLSLEQATGSTVPSADPQASGPSPCGSASSVSKAYTASQLAAAYGFASGAYAGGRLGTGETVALFELEHYKSSDISSYESCYGISTSVNESNVDGGATGSAAGTGEAALDIEDIAGLAPDATIDVYEAPNNDTGLLDEYQAIANNQSVQVVSSSWGECESESENSTVDAEETIFEQMATQGQSMMAAAGDTGSSACWGQTAPHGSNAVAVGDPASDPYVTGVGGTDLTSLGSPPTETVWNESSLSDFAGGGGISEDWTMPSWQQALGVNSHSSGTPCGAPSGSDCREVPDVSASSDPQHGYAVFWNGGWTDIGGTSAATPLWAALTALADQGCTSTAGLLNPALYSHAADLNDVTSGNNDYTPSGYTGGLYPATSGYDMASGLGTPTAALFSPGVLCSSATPATPSGVSAGATNATVSVSWSSDAGATSYQVFDATSPGAENYLGAAACTAGASTDTCIVSGLTNGTEYYFTVEATNAAGTSAPSSEVHATPEPPPPVTPAGVSAGAGNGTVGISWSSDAGATSYEVFDASGPGAENYSGAPACAASAPTDTCIASGLTNGTEYYFTVEATNGGGTSGPSSEVHATPEPPAPASPSGVSANAANAAVNVSWSSDAGATSYKVFDATSPVGENYSGATACTASAPTVTCTVNGLTNGTEYYFTVEAVNSGGTSGASSEVHATPEPPPPAAPSGLSASAGNGSAGVSWSSDAGAASYQVFDSISPGAENYSGAVACTASAPTDTCMVSGLSNGTEYYFTVEATDAGGTSTPSSEVHATPEPPPPGTPSGVSANAADAGAGVSWSSDAGATSYQVFDATSPGGENYSGAAACAASAPTVTCTVNGLTNGTEYYFTVVALNGGGSSSASPEVHATPEPSAPASPSGVSASAANAAVSVSWSSDTGATSYEVFDATTPGGETYSGATACTANASTDTCTVNGLTNGTEYYFTVVALNGGGSSSASSEVNATPEPVAPASPSGVSANPGDAIVSVSWSSDAGATAYEVFEATSPGAENDAGTSACTASAPTDRCTVNALTNGTEYYFTVEATNSGGTSGASQEVHATPEPPPPAAPSGVSAGGGNGTVSVSWSNDSSATSYQVFDATSPNGENYAGATACTTNPPTVTCAVNGLTNGTEYYFTVVALNGGGSSSASSEVHATPEPPPPGALTGVSASAASAAASVSWSSDAGATSYEVFDTTSPGGETYSGATACTANASTDTCTVNGLTNGTEYYFTVVALNGGGSSSASSEVHATPEPPPPGAPTGVSASPANATVSVSWSSDAGATSYMVFDATTPGGENYGGAMSCTAGAPTDTCAVNGLTNGTEYYFTVVALNGGGSSSASSEVHATPEPAAPAVPSGVSANAGNATASVSWSSDAGATSYEVFDATTPDGETYSGATACTANASTDTCTVNGLTNGTEYYFTVEATNGGGTSGPSSEIHATPEPPASPPPPPAPQHGYWLVGSDGGIFTFGSAQFHGSTGSLQLQRPVVGIVPTQSRNGYWLDASDGGIFAFGDAGFYGSIPGLGLHPSGSGLPNSLNAPIVGMVPSTDGGGYFMVSSDGGVFAFGDARFAGSCPGIGGCSGAAVAVMPDASGNGYWVVTATGHVYTFGDAPYYGAPGQQSAPVTSAVGTPDGQGYWILFADGAIANYGDAGNFGTPAGQFGGIDPATAIFTTSDGGGYWVASANGAVANYGDAPNDGSMLGTKLNGSIIAATGW
ncbi:MAG TPA: fibronectin type III domain-containing protein [Acidimicrobiales bacterium]